MRTPTHRPRHVVVVGAGLAGLSAAAHLRGRGAEVTVLEVAPRVGGLCHELTIDGVTHDAGPTVLTMPAIVDAPFRALGERLADRVRLTRLDPAYRATFSDGSVIEVRDTVERTAASVEQACGSAEGRRFLAFAEHCTRVYETVYEPFMHRSFDSPLGLVGRPLLELLRLGGFRSMQHQVDRLLHDKRTRRIASFQALYAGVPPSRARALYNVITYMDVVAGVYHPRGGMAAIPAALAAALGEHGVAVHTGTPARALTFAGGRVTGVRTDDDHVAADAVVLTCDPVAARALAGVRPMRRRLRRSPSCVVVRAHLPEGAAGMAAHHTIHFGTEWARTFREIVDEGRPMSDPSVLVSAPAVSDRSVAADGMQPVYILLPCPNDERVPWTGPTLDGIVDRGLRRLAERGLAVRPDQIREVVGPAEWARRGMPAGTPFSLAHTFAQTGPFRPRNLLPGVRGVALAGAGTVPGVGVPTVVVSGELAADRVLGAR
ncbi:phytoene desaturase family protein [Cumulibacter manganitolerans]|uniref:phytoene desaturase family protein n=1 Tax=Cumulibacter manganitolerans TaxID=1884992 RepID=UPI001297DA01|nr:phytoene desaturase family protein [Cumulibacter manganitolerans]